VTSRGSGPEPAAMWRVGDVVDDLFEVTRVHEQGGMGVGRRLRTGSASTYSGSTRDSCTLHADGNNGALDQIFPPDEFLQLVEHLRRG
jgi:hypothetical protein